MKMHMSWILNFSEEKKANLSVKRNTVPSRRIILYMKHFVTNLLLLKHYASDYVGGYQPERCESWL